MGRGKKRRKKAVRFEGPDSPSATSEEEDATTGAKDETANKMSEEAKSPAVDTGEGGPTTREKSETASQEPEDESSSPPVASSSKGGETTTGTNNTACEKREEAPAPAVKTGEEGVAAEKKDKATGEKPEELPSIPASNDETNGKVTVATGDRPVEEDPYSPMLQKEREETKGKVASEDGSGQGTSISGEMKEGRKDGSGDGNLSKDGGKADKPPVKTGSPIRIGSPVRTGSSLKSGSPLKNGSPIRQLLVCSTKPSVGGSDEVTGSPKRKVIDVDKLTEAKSGAGADGDDAADESDHPLVQWDLWPLKRHMIPIRPNIQLRKAGCVPFIRYPNLYSTDDSMTAGVDIIRATSVADVVPEDKNTS